MKLTKIKNYFENIKYYFLYSTCLQNNSYNENYDKVINEYLSKKIIKIERDGYHLILFFNNNIVMKIWASNRWYAFASNTIIARYPDGYRPYRDGDVIYREENSRPSYKTLYHLKCLYLDRPLKKSNKKIKKIRPEKIKIEKVKKEIEKDTNGHGKTYNKIAEFLRKF
jgi:hypothetical protein